jgi:hypothetical protein
MEVNMRFARSMLAGFLVIAAPIALARDNGTAQAPRNSGASNAEMQTPPSASGPAMHKEDKNGALSADREQGLDRARDRMSDEGRENTNAPTSPDRATGKDRAEQRHKLRESRDRPERE